MPQLSSYYNPSLTLPDILRRAAGSGNNLYIGFLNDKGIAEKLYYSDLLIDASRLAIGLVNEGLKKGDKLIIATEDGKQTLVLLWASFLCGVIPTVLQPPPTFAGYNPPVVKLLNVCQQLKSPFVFMSRVPASDDIPEELNIKTIDDLDCTGEMPVVKIDPQDIAFIQFSSGSTGDSKGIMLTHYNIMVNLDAIRIGLDLHFPDVTGNWMPLFHDMGLIGYHFTPMYCEISQWHIETIDFIKNPGLWLELLSREKVKVTGCPNFGLALTLRFLKRMKTKPQWDFSAMRALLNGAEPISVQIMNDFVEEIEQYNFQPEAMMPVYGLAEASLAATFTPLMAPSVVTSFDAVSLDRDNKAIEIEMNEERSPDDGDANIVKANNVRLLAGVGVPLNDIEIKIVDQDNNPVPEGTAGSICLRGDSITTAYYNRPEETNNSFIDGWFSTGDIGFLYKGNYYVSGRHKDIIFKNGRHYFANDLEELSCTIEGISYGKICFAGVTNHQTSQEQVIAFLAGSPGEKAHETYNLMRNLLRSTLGITLDQLIMVRSNEIPKTSSGKLQRYKLIQRYLAGEFDQMIVQ